MPRVRIYTTPRCGDCRRAKRYMDERGVPFEEVNTEDVPQAAEFVPAANRGRRRVPTFEVVGRVFYLSPFDAARLESELSAVHPCAHARRPAEHPPRQNSPREFRFSRHPPCSCLWGLTAAEEAAS